MSCSWAGTVSLRHHDAAKSSNINRWIGSRETSLMCAGSYRDEGNPSGMSGISGIPCYRESRTGGRSCNGFSWGVFRMNGERSRMSSPPQDGRGDNMICSSTDGRCPTHRGSARTRLRMRHDGLEGILHRGQSPFGCDRTRSGPSTRSIPSIHRLALGEALSPRGDQEEGRRLASDHCINTSLSHGSRVTS